MSQGEVWLKIVHYSLHGAARKPGSASRAAEYHILDGVRGGWASQCSTQSFATSSRGACNKIIVLILIYTLCTDSKWVIVITLKLEAIYTKWNVKESQDRVPLRYYYYFTDSWKYQVIVEKKILCFVVWQDFLPALLVSDSCLPASHKDPTLRLFSRRLALDKAVASYSCRCWTSYVRLVV